jgi:REP element-mobilizing transposase RayT
VELAVSIITKLPPRKRLCRKEPSSATLKGTGFWLSFYKLFWKEKTLWGDGYFACSIGEASKETIMKYIEKQG